MQKFAKFILYLLKFIHRSPIAVGQKRVLILLRPYVGEIDPQWVKTFYRIESGL